jgi:sortase A
MSAPKRWFSAAGLWLIGIGSTVLLLSGGVFLYRSVSSGRALDEFDRMRQVEQQTGANTAVAKKVELKADGPVDFHLWSPKRIQGYSDSLKVMNIPPMAVLKFEKLHIRVPVFEGTDDLTLNRGAGWVEGTAKPGEDGNIGIAAHRDGFFRALEHAKVGDIMQLDTVSHTATYAIDEIEIVEPERVSVLDPRAVPSITLVTCYPFDYVGAAPRRFIVHAALKGMSGY